MFKIMKIRPLIGRRVRIGSRLHVNQPLRWSETKNLKISIPDDIFLFSLIIIKLRTLKQLENVHQKLKLKFL